jgi:hypothetical protein
MNVASTKDSVCSAASNGEIRKLSRLIRMRAKLDRRCIKGGTPLHHASANGQSICVELLVAAGAKTETTCKVLGLPLSISTRSVYNITECCAYALANRIEKRLCTGRPKRRTTRPRR